MSRLKKFPAVGWFATGLVVAAVIIPSTAAAVVGFVGIQGTSANKADVTAAGQLQTAEATPNKFFQNASTSVQNNWVAVARPLPRFALVVDVVHVGSLNPALNSPSGMISLEVQTGSSCAGTKVGTYLQSVPVSVVTDAEIFLTPGLAVPTGDALCAKAAAVGELAMVSVSGYTVSPTAVAPGA